VPTLRGRTDVRTPTLAPAPLPSSNAPVPAKHHTLGWSV
jgi:hypothetical protein